MPPQMTHKMYLTHQTRDEAYTTS